MQEFTLLKGFDIQAVKMMLNSFVMFDFTKYKKKMYCIKMS